MSSATNNPPVDIKQLSQQIEEAMVALVSTEVREKYWITHYGANDIHPRHLVYWICVETDAEKKRLEQDANLKERLRDLLSAHEYPVSGRAGVQIGFESRETVERESAGSWWQYWK